MLAIHKWCRQAECPLRARDSWAARGWGGSRGVRVGWAGSAVGEEAREYRTQGRERRELLLPPAPQSWTGVWSEAAADLTGLGSCRVRGHNERDVPQLPLHPPPTSCPVRNPEPKACRPFQQLCQAFSWVGAQAGERSSCHPSPCRRG